MAPLIQVQRLQESRSPDTGDRRDQTSCGVAPALFLVTDLFPEPVPTFATVLRIGN